MPEKRTVGGAEHPQGPHPTAAPQPAITAFPRSKTFFRTQVFGTGEMGRGRALQAGGLASSPGTAGHRSTTGCNRNLSQMWPKTSPLNETLKGRTHVGSSIACCERAPELEQRSSYTRAQKHARARTHAHVHAHTHTSFPPRMRKPAEALIAREMTCSPSGKGSPSALRSLGPKHRPFSSPRQHLAGFSAEVMGRVCY